MSNRIMANERFLDSATSSTIGTLGRAVLEVARHRPGGQLVNPWRWIETEKYLVIEEGEDASIDERC